MTELRWYFYWVDLRCFVPKLQVECDWPSDQRGAAGLCYLPSGVPPRHIIRSANSRASSGPKLWFTLPVATTWRLTFSMAARRLRPTSCDGWLVRRWWLADFAWQEIPSLTFREKWRALKTPREKLIYGRQLTRVGHQVPENISKRSSETREPTYTFRRWLSRLVDLSRG